MPAEIKKIEFRNFRAVDHPEEALAFQNGHIDVLKNKGIIESVDSTREEWLDNPSVYLMCLYHGKKMIGGARVHAFNPAYEYPCIHAFQKKEGYYLDLSAYTGTYLHGEGCGIWATDEVMGLGMLEVVTYGAIAIAMSLGLDKVFGFGPRHTLGTFRRAGFEKISHEGKLIEFDYPSAKFRSAIVMCESRRDTYPFSREESRVFDWVDIPNFSYVQKGRSGDCLVQLSPFPTNDSIIEAHRGKKVIDHTVLLAV